MDTWRGSHSRRQGHWLMVTAVEIDRLCAAARVSAGCVRNKAVTSQDEIRRLEAEPSVVPQ